MTTNYNIKIKICNNKQPKLQILSCFFNHVRDVIVYKHRSKIPYDLKRSRPDMPCEIYDTGPYSVVPVPHTNLGPCTAASIINSSGLDWLDFPAEIHVFSFQKRHSVSRVPASYPRGGLHRREF